MNLKSFSLVYPPKPNPSGGGGLDYRPELKAKAGLPYPGLSGEGRREQKECPPV
jgi:hypothetical protein